MSDNSPIEIQFVMNSPELMEEFKKLVQGSGNVDEALTKLKDKYAQTTAAQAIGAKEADNFANALTNVGDAARNIEVDDLINKENIAIQKEVIEELENQLHAVNDEVSKPLPSGQKDKLIEESKRLKTELELEKSALNALNASLSQPSRFSIEGLTKENINIQKQVIKELEQQLKDLNKEISKKAPGTAQAQLMTEAEKLRKELEGEKRALVELDAALKNNASTQSSLQSQYRNTMNAMRELEMQGKKDSNTYRELEQKALQYKNAMSQVAREQNLLVSGNKLQGYVTGLGMMTGGLSAAQGATALLAGENQNLQKVMMKVQSLMAITIGLQQIQQGLTSTSAFQIQVLSKAKNLWAITNLRVATTLGITTVAAQVLMATLTLGLSLAIAGVILAFDHFSRKQKEAIALNKKTAESAAEPLLAYRKLKDEWNALANDINAKNRFIAENTAEFNKLGISVKNVYQAENAFVKYTSEVENALMARAKATAAMQMATEAYKKTIEAELEYDRQLDLSKNGNFWQKMVNAPNKPLKDMQEANKEGDRFYKKVIQYEKEAEKNLKKASINPTLKKIEYSQEIKDAEKKLEVEKARYGKADKMERDLYNKKLTYAKKDHEEFEKITQDKAIFEAGLLKKQDDAAQKASDKKLNKAQAAAQRLVEFAKRTQEEIAQAEENVLNKQTEGDEIASIKQRYDSLRERAKKAKLSSIDMVRIDVVEKSELDTKQYEIASKELLKSLDEQKELYAAYEALKTKIGEAEAQKRYNISFEEFGTYGDKLQFEIDQLSAKLMRTSVENERLKALTDRKDDFDKNNSQADNDKYAQAYQDSITHEEKLQQIKKTYDDKALQLQKIADANLRAAKLTENENQRQDAINAANREAYEKSAIYERMSENLIGITKRELAVRIASLKEYLSTTGNAIKAKEKDFINSEIKKAEAVQASTNIGVYEKTLLEEKQRLVEAIANKAKTGVTDPEDISRLEEINQKLKSIIALKAQQFGDAAGQLSGSFKEIASAIGDSNEGLADTLDTIGDILGIAQNAAGAFASFASGDIVGGITKTISAIAGIFSIGKKARESERKAQEELKKYQESIFQSQLDYNAELRKRILDETRLNDLYKSRVSNIKEEMEANKKNAAQIIKDQQDVFNRLLRAQTVVGMHTEKYGGFLGIGRKTRTVEDTKSIAEVLGIGKWVDKTLAFGIKIKVFEPGQVDLTDEIFDKLEKLNAEKPLTGDAKLAYEQLKKLRDEYGSIAEANRQLEIQLKNAITGTTAQALADSIREGLKSGKKSFADFADDIEGFLREAIMAGISAKMIEPKIQELQDALAEMMGDGVLSDEDRKKFQEMYMAIVGQSQEYMNLINQAGIGVGTGASANSLQGAFKAMNQESADIMSGQLGGMRLAQLETNVILKAGAAQQLAQSSKMVELQIDIEKNTRRTAENTEKIHDVNDNVVKVVNGQDKYYNALQAAGIIK